MPTRPAIRSASGGDSPTKRRSAATCGASTGRRDRGCGPSSSAGQWPVVAVGSGRDVHEPARLAHRDLVPGALRHHDGVAGAEVDQAFAVGELEADRYRAGDEVKELVAVRMHLAIVRRVAGDERRADRVPVDALRWAPRLLLDDPSLPVRGADSDDL